jgi:hypothetical protein
MTITTSSVSNQAALADVQSAPEATDAAGPQDAQTQDSAAAPPNGTPVPRSPSLPPDSAIPANIAIQLRQGAANDSKSVAERQAAPTGSGAAGTCSSTVGTELYNTSGPNANQPRLSDIQQRGCGDCYFLAPLGALAQRDPSAIKNMIKDNGDGTYTVTLHKEDNGIQNLWGAFGNSYKAEQVTVNADDVKKFTGQEGVTTDAQNCKQVTWPAVIEAAYTKMNGGANICGGGVRKPALETLTGHNAQTYSPSNASELNNLKSQFDSGKLMVVSTPENLPSSNDYGLYHSHSYTVTDVYVKDGKTYVTLNNPWGTEVPTNIPASDLKNVSNEIAVGTP